MSCIMVPESLTNATSPINFHLRVSGNYFGLPPRSVDRAGEGKCDLASYDKKTLKGVLNISNWILGVRNCQKIWNYTPTKKRPWNEDMRGEARERRIYISFPSTAIKIMKAKAIHGLSYTHLGRTDRCWYGSKDGWKYIYPRGAG